MADPRDGFVIKTEFNGGVATNATETTDQPAPTAANEFTPGSTSSPAGSSKAPAAPSDRFPFLRGRDHQADFVQGSQELRDAGLLFDYHIMAGEQRFPAHHAILAAHSGFIRRRAADGRPNELDLTNLSPAVVQALLDFVYMGETTISYDHLEDLFAIGKRLEIPGLTSHALVDSGDDEYDNGDNLDDEFNSANKKRKSPKKPKRSAANTDLGKDKKRKVVPTEDIQRFPKKKDGEEFVRSEKSGMFVCSYCYATFASKYGVLRHVALHTGEAKTHKCFTCEYQSTVKGNVKKHAVKHHGMDGDVFDTLWKQREQEQGNGNSEGPVPSTSTSVKKEPKHSKKIKQEAVDPEDEGGKKR